MFHMSNSTQLTIDLKYHIRADEIIFSPSTGFPRNMMDTGEYLEQVGRLDGVILLNWSEEKLIKQVQAS